MIRRGHSRGARGRGDRDIHRGRVHLRQVPLPGRQCDLLDPPGDGHPPAGNLHGPPLSDHAQLAGGVVDDYATYSIYNYEKYTNKKNIKKNKSKLYKKIN